MQRSPLISLHASLENICAFVLITVHVWMSVVHEVVVCACACVFAVCTQVSVQYCVQMSVWYPMVSIDANGQCCAQLLMSCPIICDIEGSVLKTVPKYQWCAQLLV